MSNALTSLFQLDNKSHVPEVDKPVLVSECAQEIKAVGGAIWLLQKLEDGLLIRAEFGAKQFRLFLRHPSGQPADGPQQETNSPLHIIRDVPTLRAWLLTLAA